MKDLQKKYFLSLEPYVHIFSNNRGVLFYNTITGARLEYERESLAYKLSKQFLHKRNLYVLTLSEKALEEPSLKTFVKDLKKTFMGDLVRSSSVKPVQLMPILNFQKNAKRFKHGFFSTIGDNIISHLFEISIYINSCDSGTKEFIFKDAYKQFPAPIYNNSSRALDFAGIQQFLTQSRNSNIHKINILGGDVFSYDKFTELSLFLNTLKAEKHYHLFCRDVLHAENIEQLLKKDSLSVYITCPVDVSCLDEFLVYPTEKLQFVFIVANDKDVNEAMSYVRDKNVDNYVLQPYFNGQNLSFFQEHVFLTKQDIFSELHSQNDIFSNLEINRNEFGKLVVLNNGKVYCNVNKPALGNIYIDSLHSLLAKEIRSTGSWRRLRKNATNCKSCLYNLLCPPLSGYEIALKRSNLCKL